MSAFQQNSKIPQGENAELFDEYMDKTREIPIPILEVLHKKTGKLIPVTISLNTIFDPNLTLLRKKISYLTKNEWMCHICQTRSENLSLQMFINPSNGSIEPVLCSDYNGFNGLLSEKQYIIHEKCKSLIKYFIKEHFEKLELKISTSKTYFQNQLILNKDPYSSIEYKHYSYIPKNCISMDNYSSDTESSCPVWKNDYQKYEKALQKYFRLVVELLNKTNPDKNILSSLELLEALLNKSKYGKEQLPACRWFIDIISNILTYRPRGSWKSLSPSQKIKTVCHSIINSHITEGDNSDAFIGEFHTSNNFILDILEKGHSPEAVVKMIEMRNDPRKFKQKTAPPKEVHVVKAMELCKNLVNTIHTTREIEQFDTCYKIYDKYDMKNSSDTSVDDAFSSMLKSARSKKSNKYGMAGRFGDRTVKDSPNPKTIHELIDYVNDGSISSLKLRFDTGGNIAYTANTSLNPSDLAYSNVGHLWLYKNDLSIKYQYSKVNELEISHIYVIIAGQRENYIFVVKGSRSTLYDKPIKGNCTIAEFLAAKHHSAKSAFAALSKTTNVKVPAYGEISMGVGASVAKESGEMFSSMKFIINNDKRVSISHAYYDKKREILPIKREN